MRRRQNVNLITETGATAILFEERKAVGAVIRRADGSGDALRANTVIVSAGPIHSPPW
jgi:choline dehydrogenase-like flavoprotein